MQTGDVPLTAHWDINCMHRSIKMVATLGPASSTAAQILDLARSGVDVFRLNMSHGDHNAVACMHKFIRDAETTLARPIGILADL